MKNLLVMLVIVMSAGVSVQAEGNAGHTEAKVCMKDKKVVDQGAEKDVKKLEAACTKLGGTWEVATKKKAGGGGW